MNETIREALFIALDHLERFDNALPLEAWFQHLEAYAEGGETDPASHSVITMPTLRDPEH